MARHGCRGRAIRDRFGADALPSDRKSTRLNSSHVRISYAAFCLKKKSLKTPARIASQGLGEEAATNWPAMQTGSGLCLGAAAGPKFGPASNLADQACARRTPAF